MIKKKLCEIALVQAGGTPSRNKQEYWNGNIPWVKISNINNKFVTTFDETITDKGLANSSAKIFEKGTILYTIFATLGRVGILTFDATTNQAIAGIKVTDKRFTNDYVFYYLKSLESYVKDIGNGAAQQNINLSILKNFEIPLIDIYEQNKITDELEKIEELLTIKANQFEVLDELVKSRFIEMFANYEKTNLCDIATITMGQSPDSKSYNDEGIGMPFFQGKADYGDKYTKVAHWTTEPSKKAKQGDVLMSVRAPVGPVNISSCDCCIGRGLCSISGIKDKTNNEFLYCALNAIQDDISQMGNGSTFHAITKNDVYKIQMPNAPIEFQNEFAKFTEQIDKSKFIVQQQIKDLQELLDKKMSEYFDIKEE